MSVVRRDEEMPKSVVDPTLFTLKRVEVAEPLLEEPIAKSVLVWGRRRPVVVETKMESGAKGEVVPIPTFPPTMMNCVVVARAREEEEITKEGVAGD